MKVIYENAAKDITLGQAIRMHKRLGIAIEVNDGKDLTLTIEKEPTSRQTK